MADLKETAAEQFDAVNDGQFALALPEANSDYAYAHARFFHFWPNRNSKGATYFAEDLDADLLGTLQGKMINLDHDHGKVVGTVVQWATTSRGVEGVVEIDRDKAKVQNLDIERMRTDPQYFSSTSIELTRNPLRSKYLIHDDQGNILEDFPSETASDDMGLRRTSRVDPFKYKGNWVTERVVPQRFTGLALTSQPSDKDAIRWKMTASDPAPKQNVVLKIVSQSDSAAASKPEPQPESTPPPPVNLKPQGDVHYADPGFEADGKSRFPLNTPELVRDAIRFYAVPHNVAQFTPAQQARITEAIAIAAKQFGINVKETASAVESSTMTDVEIAALQERAAKAEADLANLKETASDDRAELLVRELNDIHPFKDDAERAKFKETAMKAAGNDGVVRELKLERKNTSLENSVVELKAKLADAEKVLAAANASDASKVKAEAEKAAAEKALLDAQAASDKEAADKVTAEKAAADKAASEKEAADKAEAHKAAGSDKFSKETASDASFVPAVGRVSLTPQYGVAFSDGVGGLTLEDISKL